MNSSKLVVHERLQNHPVVKWIKNVSFDLSRDTIADFATDSSCVILLSVQLHLKNEDYALGRLRSIGKNYKLRVLLVLVDEDRAEVLNDLNKLAFQYDFTLWLAWSPIEAARYIESIKQFEGKSSQSIQEKVEEEYLPRVTKLLTTVKSVSKSDVVTLLDNFGDLANVLSAKESKLLQCRGLGDKKVKRLFQIFNEPFQKNQKTSYNAQVSSSSSRAAEASGPFEAEAS